MTSIKSETRNLLRDYEEKVTVLKTKIIEHIKTLPDNPKITRHGDVAFSLHFEDLNESWSPFYHDFKAQYSELIKIINTKPVDQVMKDFEEIVKTGHTGKRAGDSAKKYNPVVRNYLKEMM